MKKPYLVPGLLVLLVGSAAASVVACSPKDSAIDPDAAGGSDSAHPSGGDGDGSAGSPDGAGGGDAAAGAGGAASGATNGGGTANGGDAAGEAGAGANGEAGATGNSTADALPASTFLYVYSDTPTSDLLIARDFITGQERVVTDLRGDGSEGWEIWGHAISPDRRRIALASLYAPTAADVATKLATRNIFTLGSDGGDFQRLTPPSPNTGGGLKDFSISIDDPAFSADGNHIIFDMGNWWYEGTELQGGSQPWYVPTSGDDQPKTFDVDGNNSCTIVTPSVNPVTGEIVLIHSVCLSSAEEGIFLYPPAGGAPTKLVAKGYGGGAVDPALEKASWLGDGSGFLFVASREITQNNSTVTLSSLVLYDMTSGDITPLIDAPAGTYMRSAAIAPDGSGIVYCLSHDGGLDLHAIDLTLDPAEDVAITNDGKSCDPGF